MIAVPTRKSRLIKQGLSVRNSIEYNVDYVRNYYRQYNE